MKYKCVEEVYSYTLGDVIREGSILEVKEDISHGNTWFVLFSEDGSHIGDINSFLLNRYFEPYIEEQEECMVTKEEFDKSMDNVKDIAKKELGDKMRAISQACASAGESMNDIMNPRIVYKGWDIIRLIAEGKLKEGTKLYDNNTTCSCTYEYGCLIDDCEEEVNMEYIIHGEFEIDEPVELVTFKEALNKKLKIRHKDWDSSISFTTPQNALSFMAKYKEEEIDNMLYEDKCWEVES